MVQYNGWGGGITYKRPVLVSKKNKTKTSSSAHIWQNQLSNNHQPHDVLLWKPSAARKRDLDLDTIIDYSYFIIDWLLLNTSKLIHWAKIMRSKKLKSHTFYFNGRIFYNFSWVRQKYWINIPLLLIWIGSRPTFTFLFLADMGNHTFTDHSGRKGKETQTLTTKERRNELSTTSAQRALFYMQRGAPPPPPPPTHDTATHRGSATGLLLPSARGLQVKQESISYLQGARSRRPKTVLIVRLSI